MDKRLLVIAWDEWAWRLQRYLQLHWGEERVQTLCLDRRLFDDEPFVDVEDLNELYEQVCCFLNQQYHPESLRYLTVLMALQVDLPPERETERPSRDVWNPLLRYDPDRNRPHSRAIWLSWLVLTYPEVRWVFLPEQDDGCKDDFNATIHYWNWLCNPDAGAILRPQDAISVLFDPTGLRSRIRRQASRRRELQEDPQQTVSSLPARRQVAVSMDEEEEYAYFSAYTAYRFGYRAWVVTTWREAQAVLGKDKQTVHLSLEDLYLNFPDRPERLGEEETHLSNLQQRDKHLPALQRLERRVLVTVGHKRWALYRRSNREYQRSLSYRTRTLYKPYAGAFDLWRRIGHWCKWRNQPKPAKGFNWPPDREKRSEQVSEEERMRHSAPGRLVVIAERLLDRAEQMLEELTNVPEAIHAALLALEAKELLGTRTPTASLHALCTQHEAEVAAESMFTGVEYATYLKPRFAEIRREVNAIARWFHPARRARSGVHAQLTVVERMAKRLQQMRQFEEEMYCLSEARVLRFRLWWMQSAWRVLAWPILWYIGFALRSLATFGVALVAWIFLFGLGYYMLAAHVEKLNDMHGFWGAVMASAYSAFSLQPMPGWEGIMQSGEVTAWGRLLLTCESFVSFLNLGLLISHLYLIVTRR